MKIGMIGIGDIAKKAYLPVITRMKNVELFLVSRNQDTIQSLLEEYKHIKSVETIEELSMLGMDAVMIHAKTEVHPEMCFTFLNKKIPVFVDKPVSMEIDEVRTVFQTAKEQDVLFRVGFNRRCSPEYKRLAALGRPDVILYQKNRFERATNLKRYIFDDFIHVADTIRFFMDEPILNVFASNKMLDDVQRSLHVHFVGKDVSATAVMHRDSGVTEEHLELIWPGKKVKVSHLTDVVVSKGDQTITRVTKDWEPTLTKRGFQAMIEQFLCDVEKDKTYHLSDDSALETHELCETIYQILNQR